MILQYNGQNVSQNNIVIEVIGNSCNRSASGNQIETAFDGWRGYTVYSCQSKKPQYFIDEISSGHPLIIGIGEHAYLLTHIYYKEALNGMLHPFKAILINPKSGNEEVKDWNDMYSNANTIVSFHRYASRACSTVSSIPYSIIILNSVVFAQTTEIACI